MNDPQQAGICNPMLKKPNQVIMTHMIKGKHDTLPIPKTFRTPLPSLENVIRLKAKGCKRYGKLTEKVGHTCSLSSPMKVDR